MMKIKIMGLVNRWRAGSTKSGILSQNSSNKLDELDVSSMTRNEAGKANTLKDTGILPYVIRLWTKGQLNEITEIDFALIESDPHRAIALSIVAMSHQRLGNQSEFKNFTLLSFEWAEDKHIIKNILLSETWLQLALCFKSVNLTSDAHLHLEKAIQYAPFSSDIRKAFEADDIQQDVAQKNPHKNFADNITDQSEFPHAFEKGFTVIDQHLLQLSNKIEEQSLLLAKSTQEIKDSVKAELENNTHQIEAFLDLQNFFNHGRHLPKMHGWPISPDLALYLVDIINSNSYDAIIEFGSGTSTLLIAQTLDLKARNTQKDSIVRQVAFEHLPEYYEKTNAELKQHGLNNNVNLQLTPLKPANFTGGSYSYYSCDDVLEELSLTLPMATPKVLALVDGPPARTGKHARFPALPILLKYFSHAEIDIVLDDFARTEEKSIVSLWTTILEQSQEHTYKLDPKRMEKDACLISIRNAYS
jgi:hypothetical protein